MPSTPPIKVPILGVDMYSKEFKNMTKRAQKMGRAIEGVGRKTSALVTVPLLAAGGASVKFARDLNQSMANVGTLIPNQTKRLVGMKEAVQNLAVETGVSAMTISQGLYDTISAFGDAEDPINKLTIATKMSKAGLSDVQEALGLVSAVTKGYGNTSDEAAQKASDLAFLTVKLGQTTFPDLAVSIGKVVPMAATLKVSQEELFGAMATLTGVTGNAAEVSTQLRSVLGAMIKPSADMTKAAKKMGYTSAVAMVEEEGLAKSIELLGQVTGGSTEELGKLLTRKEGLTAALALLGGQSDAYAEKTAAMGKAAGATDEAFRQMTDGINKDGHQMDQARQRIEKAAVAVGDKLLPVVVKLTDKIVPMIDRIADADEATLEWGIKIAAGAAAVGPLLIVTGKMITIYPTAIKLLTLYGARLGMVTMNTKAAKAATAQAAIQQQIYDGKLKASNMTFKQSVTSMGKVNSALSVLAAGAFGWEVGTLIYDNLVKPFQDSLNLMSKVDAKVKDLAQPGGTKIETTKSLQQTASDLRKTIRTQENLEMVAGARGFATESKKLQTWKKQLAGIESEIGIRKQEDKIEKGGFADVAAGQSVFGAVDYRFDEAALMGLKQSRQESESKISISFDGLPEGVTPKVTKQGGNVGVKSGGRGAVLPAGGM